MFLIILNSYLFACSHYILWMLLYEQMQQFQHQLELRF
jgi:hypothetical protein